MALSDGRVYAYGDARSYGDASTNDWTGGSVPPGAPIVGIAAAAGSDSGGLLPLGWRGTRLRFRCAYYGEPDAVDGTPSGHSRRSAGRWVLGRDLDRKRLRVRYR